MAREHTHDPRTVIDHNPVTTAFGLLGILGGIAFATDPGLLTSIGVTIIAVGGVFGGLLGRGFWRVLVESYEYGSLPARGALAGGVVGFVWLSPFLTIVFTLGRYGSVTEFFAGFTSVNAVLEFGAGFVIFALYGLFVIGWATIPVGILTGYLIGRGYAENVNR